jgi:serine/threonine protein kinase
MTDFDAQRDPLEVLAEEFVERHRRGEHPSIAEYAEAHPALAEQIRTLFPSMLMLEHVHEQQEELHASGSEAGKAAPHLDLQRIGDYHILREQGRGGMGVVYEARQESLGRRVALKVLFGPGASEKHRQRFEREARAAAQLHHTNIVPVFGVGREEGISYYVMQYIEGQSLGEYLQGLKHSTCTSVDSDLRHPAGPVKAGVADTLPLADQGTEKGRREPRSGRPAGAAAVRPRGDRERFRWVAEVGLQVADALHYAHSQGVIHRDIKPANLLLDPQGKVWITDFGVAHWAEEEELTGAGDVVGTLRYMAPEQLNGEADPRSDVYSLGLTLYELLTLRPAFEDISRTRLLRQITDGQLAHLRTLCPEIPRDLDTIVAKAIAREAKDRYATAAELADDLRRWLEDLPIRARRVGTAERLWRWGRRNRTVAALAAVALASLVTATAVGWTAYLRTHAALGEARDATRRAESNLGLSLKAFETIFNQVAGRDSVQPIAEDPEVELLLPTIPSEHDLRLLQQILQFYERFADQNQSNQLLRAETARAYRRVGEIQQKLGRLEQAGEALQHALTIYKALASDGEPSEATAIETAAVYNAWGFSLQLSGKNDEARQAYEQALTLLNSRQSDRSRLEVIRTHNQLGRLLALPRPGGRPERHGPGHEGPGSPSEAEGHHRQALELAQALIARDPKNPDYRFALAQSQEYLSLARLSGENKEPALEANRQAIGQLKELSADFPSVALYRQELAEAYLLSGGPMRLLFSCGDASDRIQQAQAIAEKLHADHPQVPDYVLLLARANSRYASLLAMNRQFPESLAYHRKSVELLQSLADRYATVPWFGYMLAASRQSLAEYLRSAKLLPEARTELEKSIQTTEQLARLHREPSRRVEFFLARQYFALSGVLRQMGQNPQADEAMAKARALMPAWSEHRPPHGAPPWPPGPPRP